MRANIVCRDRVHRRALRRDAALAEERPRQLDGRLVVRQRRAASPFGTNSASPFSSVLQRIESLARKSSSVARLSRKTIREPASSGFALMPCASASFATFASPSFGNGVRKNVIRSRSMSSLGNEIFAIAASSRQLARR